MAQYSLNEVLKARAASEEGKKKDDGEVKLDDVTRVKVLSPTRKVIKRFKKNRLAMFGLYLLISMFVIAFIGPLFYAWGQTDIFYKNEDQYREYAMIKNTETFSPVDISGTVDNNNKVALKMNSFIKSMGETGSEKLVAFAEGKKGEEAKAYLVEKKNDFLYTLSDAQTEKICEAGLVEEQVAKCDILGKDVHTTFTGEEIPGVAAKAKEVLKSATKDTGNFEVDGSTYNYRKSGGKTYNLFTMKEGLNYFGEKKGAEFEEAVKAVLEGGANAFELGGASYVAAANETGDVYTFYQVGDVQIARAYTTLSAHLVHLGSAVPENLRYEALKAVLEEKPDFKIEHINFNLSKDEAGNIQVLDENGELLPLDDDEFEYNGATYTVKENEDGYQVLNAEGKDVLVDLSTYTVKEIEKGYEIYDTNGELFAELTNYSVKRNTGEDTIEYAMKTKFIEAVEHMQEGNLKKYTIRADIPAQDSNGAHVFDENGKTVYKESDVDITKEGTGEYVVRCNLVTHLIDRFGSPSRHHLLGTDGDGFDVLSRIMYGGRISLLVGFVVVFLEIILGVIMGGLAGYYGKWVDMLVMRLVDVFYCLPSMPILIIVGAAMDASRLNPYIRLLVMIASLGIMGWAGVARMVRGQILSLREQEFMVAAEATGIKVRSRIFRHLIPNVMPQLIVIATMGMGGVILTESTLSYLGLGVKHPLATWGSMINSVSTATAMKYYPYIWIPVGMLICLTVIAFNFVGDGLRDAYDPKSNK